MKVSVAIRYLQYGLLTIYTSMLSTSVKPLGMGPMRTYLV